MLDIIFKIFGALAMVMLCIHLFEWLYYRKMKGRGHLLVDLRGAEESICLENLELISATLQKNSGRALISRAYVLIDHDCAMNKNSISRTMKLLDLKSVTVIEERGFTACGKNNNGSFQENPTATEIHF